MTAFVRRNLLSCSFEIGWKNKLTSKTNECCKVVIPEVVIGNPVLDVNGWVPDNDFGNDDRLT